MYKDAFDKIERLKLKNENSYNEARFDFGSSWCAQLVMTNDLCGIKEESDKVKECVKKCIIDYLLKVASGTELSEEKEEIDAIIIRVKDWFDHS